MPFKDPQRALEDILENIARMERFTSGLTEETFRSDEQAVFAVQYALLVISEAARRLGDDADTLCPGMPWDDIRGIGNWLRHGYDRIDPGIIWNTAKKDLNELQRAVASAVQKLKRQTGSDTNKP